MGWSLKWLSGRFLNASIDGASMVSCGILFHQSMTLLLKKYNLLSVLQCVSFCSLEECPLLVSSGSSFVIGFTSQNWFMYLYTLMRSPLSLRYTRVARCSTFSCSSKGRSRNTATLLVARRWIFSISSACFHVWGDHTDDAYSRWGLIIDLHSITNTFLAT